jgi:hypothetical protein
MRVKNIGGIFDFQSRLVRRMRPSRKPPIKMLQKVSESISTLIVWVYYGYVGVCEDIWCKTR